MFAYYLNYACDYKLKLKYKNILGVNFYVAKYNCFRHLQKYIKRIIQLSYSISKICSFPSMKCVFFINNTSYKKLNNILCEYNTILDWNAECSVCSVANLCSVLNVNVCWNVISHEWNNEENVCIVLRKLLRTIEERSISTY